jgi:hypothetical protein
VQQRGDAPGTVAAVSEQLRCPLSRRERGRGLQARPLLHRQAGEGLAECGVVPEVLPQLYSLLRGAQRLAPPVRVEQRPGIGLDELCPVRRRQQIVPAQDLFEQGGALALCSCLDRLPRRRRGMRHHGHIVAGLDGVVHDPRQVRLVLREQRRQHPLVEPHPLARRARPLDGAAGQLVPEARRVGPDLQDPAALGLAEHREVSQQGAGQPQLDPRRHHGELLQRSLGGHVQLVDPRQHHVHHRRRRRAAR